MKNINDKTIKGFKQFNEESVKAVVFTFGRFNPPTVGHGKLITKVAAAAIGNQYRIYASQSNDSKKNPLKYKEKIRVMRKMFPKHGRNIIEDKNAKTALHIASILHDQGFTRMTMVVGSDRITEFQKLLKNYNAIIETLEKEKSNNTVKGDLIKSAFVTSTMGVAYKLKLGKSI